MQKKKKQGGVCVERRNWGGEVLTKKKKRPGLGLEMHYQKQKSDGGKKEGLWGGGDATKKKRQKRLQSRGKSSTCKNLKNPYRG